VRYRDAMSRSGKRIEIAGAFDADAVAEDDHLEQHHGVAGWPLRPSFRGAR
jgi:hypothetical protein